MEYPIKEILLNDKSIYSKSKLLSRMKQINKFGKKNFIKKAFKSFERKGTVGTFTRWCKNKGHSGVTPGCISEGKQSKSLKTRRRAIFAQNIKHRSGHSLNSLNSLNSDIKYLLKK